VLFSWWIDLLRLRQEFSKDWWSNSRFGFGA